MAGLEVVCQLGLVQLGADGPNTIGVGMVVTRAGDILSSEHGTQTDTVAGGTLMHWLLRIPTFIV